MPDEPAAVDRTPPPDQPPRTVRPPPVIDQHGKPAGDAARPAGATAAESPPANAEPPPRRSLLAPVLGVVGFLILAGAVSYIWYQQQQAQSDLAAQVAALGRQSRPGPFAAALADRVDALERRKAPDLNQPDLNQIESRLAAVEQRLPVQLGQLQGQVSNLEQQVAGIAQLSRRVDSLARQAQSIGGQSQQADSALTRRLGADESRLATLEQSAGKISQLAARVTHLVRLQSAQMALAQGHQLGEIEGAPTALARYATAAPPTVAALRLAFPEAARAASAASLPDAGEKSFLARVKAHAEELVTVRQGDHVLIGDATAGVLARARAALDAGDLAAAVDAVSSLSGPPAKAMAGWLDQARALLAARSALADMVAHA